jgi:hypothetical protein
MMGSAEGMGAVPESAVLGGVVSELTALVGAAVAGGRVAVGRGAGVVVCSVGERPQATRTNVAPLPANSFSICRRVIGSIAMFMFRIAYCVLRI